MSYPTVRLYGPRPRMRWFERRVIEGQRHYLLSRTLPDGRTYCLNVLIGPEVRVACFPRSHIAFALWRARAQLRRDIAAVLAS